ncbi:very short patch repair endonuclease [Planotetraspora silvatica]|nr:very short patch repair endonuclease [Planotetraspora silvatica]
MARDQGLLVDLQSFASRESWASSPATRAVMRGNRSRDTRPERILRSAVYALGLRYRVAFPPMSGLRRTADMVFTRAKVAVFVDGCYWHGCPEHYRPARKNSDFWKKKIESNQERDRQTQALLQEEGWSVIRVWEHEDVDVAAARIAETVRNRGDVSIPTPENRERLD